MRSLRLMALAALAFGAWLGLGSIETGRFGIGAAEAAGGCGPGFHRSVYGYCRPNVYGGYYGAPGYRRYGYYGGRAYGYRGGYAYRGAYGGRVYGGRAYGARGAYGRRAVGFHGGRGFHGGGRGFHGGGRFRR
ncbi:GCG_CRPN prefix-to-repeats domain-containing protein [Methylobacterium nigriterrae]|uniref:GCG_CRPN prefix-to-repeats domain-containing protein n=1 Tax=Methylobacterium nigriterrae TaxID=3127512 RepID=UPI003013890D